MDMDIASGRINCGSLDCNDVLVSASVGELSTAFGSAIGFWDEELSISPATSFAKMGSTTCLLKNKMNK